MNLKDMQSTLFSTLSTDETLLRLLIYKPQSQSDSPLDPSKANIMDMAEEQRYDYINDRIYFTPSIDGLDVDTPKCRIVFYPGRRKSDNGNYMVSSQEIIFDVFAHKEYNNMDMRCSWICDRISELLFGSHLVGMGEIKVYNGKPINAPMDYTGYQLVFDIGSGN